MYNFTYMKIILRNDIHVKVSWGIYGIFNRLCLLWTIAVFLSEYLEYWTFLLQLKEINDCY